MVGAWLLLCLDCVSSEVTYTGAAKYPAKPRGCAIEVFPSTTPAHEWEDLATVEARCHTGLQGRTACIDELKAQACGLGGDSVYALKDGVQGEYSIVIGTIARHKDGAAKSEIAKVGDTPCSPGYKCAEAQCIAVCNPACDEGMFCNKHRICQIKP